ncbi:MAG: hypothetical protein R2939_22025 [Kofleriaceae bacterium]
MERAARVVCVGVTAAVAVGCRGEPSHRPPTGTLSDPVEVCTRLADVCRIDAAKLGICSQDRTGAKLVCASQH